jgi:hypothetical protein
MWAGLFACSGSATADSNSYTFGEARLWQPSSRDVFRWYVYRAPALGGSPDVPGARGVVARLKPAHTLGGVSTASTGLLCDDAESLIDLTPLGV